MIKFSVLFIGCGKMGTSILDGVLSKSIINVNDIFIVEPNNNQRNLLKKKGICVFKNISEVNIKKLGIKALLIAVKPQILEKVAFEIKEHIDNDIPVITLVAGKTIKFYKSIFGNNTSIIRVMPNTPASFGKGISAVYPCKKTKKIDLEKTKKIFTAVGKVITLKQEKQMDIVTAISGSGPAYVFLFIENLIQTAISNGLEKKIAEVLVKETFLGSSFMASISNKSPEELRIDVTSPGGVTQAALEEFNKNSIFKNTIEKAIKSAVKKSITLSN